MKKETKSLVAAFIAERMKEINKPQKDIAAECGWPKPNVITMLKTGQMKVPLDKVGVLAKALRVDPAYLFWLTLSEYAADTLEALVVSMRGSIVLNPYERRVVQAYRDLVGDNTTKPVTISDGRKSIGVKMIDSE
jgi:hypothetical protein